MTELGGPGDLSAFRHALLQDDPEALYQRAPCGFVSTAPSGTITKVNETFLTMTGYRREELEGLRSFADLLTGGGRIYHETHIGPTLLMEGSINGVALDLRHSDGSRLPVLVHSVLERDGADEPSVVRTAVFDATERREYEQELLRAKERAEASEVAARRLARTLQQTLIPPALPSVPGVDVAAEYRPAGEGELIGGDFYDLFQVATDDWVIALGDVCGKGPDATVITALVRYTIRAAAVEHPSPAAMLHVLNEVVIRHEDDRFCTALVARLRRTADGWTVALSTGGHPLPLLARPGADPVPVGCHGSIIGVFGHATFTAQEVALHDGDLLLLYTDGVTEGRSGSEFYGEDRLRAVLAANADSSAAAATSAVLEDVVAFQAGLQRDDIALLAVRLPHP